MPRSTVPVRQAPIPLAGPSQLASFDEGGTPRWKPEPFPTAPPSGTVLGSGRSINQNNPVKGSTVALDLGGGQVITAEVMDYFIMLDGQEYVQVKMGPNIYLRPSANIK